MGTTRTIGFARILFLVALSFPGVSALGQVVTTDRETIKVLKSTLVAGGDIYYPAEAARKGEGGRGTYAMHLRKDGSVESVGVLNSTGSTIIDSYMQKVLLSYRFRPGVWSPVVFSLHFVPPKDPSKMRVLPPNVR